MQFPGLPGVPPPRPGGNAATPAQLAAAQQLQQMQQMQAALAANPALAAQFAQQQALMAQRMAAAAHAGGNAAAVAAAAAGRPLAPTAAKGAAAGTKGSAAGTSATPATATHSIEAVPAKKAGPSRKRKAAGDQRLPDRGDLLIPDSPLFTQLQDAERRLDMLISRKKHELQEMFASFRRGPPGSAAAVGTLKRKLRVYVRSEHHNQQHAADAAEPPSWQLTISGRLLKDKERGADAAAEDPGAGPTRQLFTHYMRRVAVQLDPEQYPGDQGQVVWDKALHERDPKEAIQVRRLGSRLCTARITLEVDHQPPRYRVSPELAAALDLRGLHSLPYVLQMLWAYIKAHQLYEPSDKGPVSVRCDEQLRPVFGGAESVELSKVAEGIKPHLTPPDPAIVEYTINPGGPAVAHPDCYDFEIEVPASTELPPYALKPGAGREVEGLEAALGSTLSRLAEHRRRRTFLLAFAQNPVDFVLALVSAQGRELRLASSKEGEAYELLATGDVFRERWVDDSVMNYMARKQATLAAQQAAVTAEQQQGAAQQAVAMTAVATGQQPLTIGGTAAASLQQQTVTQAQALQQQLLQQRMQQQRQQQPKLANG